MDTFTGCLVLTLTLSILCVSGQNRMYVLSPVRYRTSGSTSPGERDQAASGDPWATTGSVTGFSTQV